MAAYFHLRFALKLATPHTRTSHPETKVDLHALSSMQGWGLRGSKNYSTTQEQPWLTALAFDSAAAALLPGLLAS
jgi:hypothetical protein